MGLNRKRKVILIKADDGYILEYPETWKEPVVRVAKTREELLQRVLVWTGECMPGEKVKIEKVKK